MRQLAQRSPKLVSRRSADLTEILREDDVRPELVEEDLVDLIEALARREVRGDGAIDVVLRESLEWQRGFADYRQQLYLRWIVALVRAPDELVSGAEGVGDFCRRWEEGDYAHDQESTLWTATVTANEDYLPGAVNGAVVGCALVGIRSQ